MKKGIISIIALLSVVIGGCFFYLNSEQEVNTERSIAKFSFPKESGMKSKEAGNVRINPFKLK